MFVDGKAMAVDIDRLPPTCHGPVMVKDGHALVVQGARQKPAGVDSQDAHDLAGHDVDESGGRGIPRRDCLRGGEHPSR